MWRFLVTVTTVVMATAVAVAAVVVVVVGVVVAIPRLQSARSGILRVPAQQDGN
jgi:hypothetical protein